MYKLLYPLAVMISFSVSSLLSAEREMRLRLKDGSFSVGQVVPSKEADRLGWVVEGLEDPLHFDVRSIRSVSSILEQDHVSDDLAGTQLFQLSGGSVLSGKLLAVNDEFITVDSRILGKVRVQRDHVLSFTDAGYAGEVVYSGPKEDGSWNTLSKDGDWEFHAGSLVANKQDASILGNVDLPQKAQVNLVLSWRGVADFVFSFGTPDGNSLVRGQIPAAARLEVWDKQLALVREVPSNADIALISELAAADSRVDLTLFIDQEAGTVTACDANGRPLETIRAVSSENVSRRSVHLINHGPSLTLERLVVRKWDGRTSTATAGARLNVVDAAGRFIEGAISGFDPESSKVSIQPPGEEQPLSLPLADIRRADFQPPAGLKQGSDPTADDLREDIQGGESQEMEPMEIILTDRTRLWGRWLPAEDSMLGLAVSGVSLNEQAASPLRFSPEDLRGLIGTNDRYRPQFGQHKYGTLKLGGSELAGHLVESSPIDSATALIWHPHGSLNASQILPSASGGIVYRHALPRVTKSSKSVNLDEQGKPPGAGGTAKSADALKSDGRNSQEGDEADVQRELMFRSGDAIDGRVERIDERGLYFTSEQTTNNFAKHSQIQSVWLNRLQKTAELPSEKLKRFMTVPRALKDDPPTQVLIAVTGDHLRCRLLSLDQDKLTVEIGLEVAEIPRDRVAQIIWLHDRDWEQADKSGGDQEDASVQQPPFQVHGTYGMFHGLTFQPRSMRAGVLRGTSDLLGDCSLDIKTISQLLFGRNIALRVREFREDPWTLSLAQYPRVFLDGGNGAQTGGTGMQSTLIGAAAPDFSLRDLAGQTFRLNKLRNQIVVLDFWASWCGPCMQTMPLVDAAVAEVGEQNVTLIAVNIQETPGRAQAALERLGIDATVVLDLDGEVATAYEANAIPQTVIIDRRGLVTHVFVGGGPRFLVEFKAALGDVLKE